jgi:tRNA A37 threonylcarbamoyltransferase TsaD
MPKAKPTQVIVHRIELQEKERDALEAIVTGQTVKNVVVPVVAGGAVVSASYLSYKALKAAYDWGDDAVDRWYDKVKKAIVIDTSEGPDISTDWTGNVTNNETGETKRAYPLPYYWIKALFE